MPNVDSLNLERIIQVLGSQKAILIEKYGVDEIGVFGSYVHENQTGGSDIDILVEFRKDAKIGLLKFVNMENYLSDLLGAKVDLVMKKSLKPHIGARILQEVIYI